MPFLGDFVKVNPKWSVKNFVKNVDSIYTDIDMYFIEPIPFFAFAEEMYDSIQIGMIDIPMTSKEMLKRG